MKPIQFLEEPPISLGGFFVSLPFRLLHSGVYRVPRNVSRLVRQASFFIILIFDKFSINKGKEQLGGVQKD
jgi:hypothetical protein